MTIFDVIRYPIDPNNTKESFGALPYPIKTKYWDLYTPFTFSTLSKETVKNNLALLKRLILEYEGPNGNV